MHALITDGGLVPCIAEFEKSDKDAVFKPKMFEGVEFTFVIDGTLVLASEGEVVVFGGWGHCLGGRHAQADLLLPSRQSGTSNDHHAAHTQLRTLGSARSKSRD